MVSSRRNLLPYEGSTKDPIYPYLYVLTMERLGHVTHRAVANCKWRPITVGRGGPSLSNIFFIDDLVLFGEQLWKMQR